MINVRWFYTEGCFELCSCVYSRQVTCFFSCTGLIYQQDPLLYKMYSPLNDGAGDFFSIKEWVNSNLYFIKFSPFLGGARCQLPLRKKSLLTILLLGILWTQPKESAVPVQGGYRQAKQQSTLLASHEPHRPLCLNLCFETSSSGEGNSFVWYTDNNSVVRIWSLETGWLKSAELWWSDLSNPFGWWFLLPLEMVFAAPAESGSYYSHGVSVAFPCSVLTAPSGSPFLLWLEFRNSWPWIVSMGFKVLRGDKLHLPVQLMVRAGLACHSCV